MYQADHILSDLKDKLEDLFQISTEQNKAEGGAGPHEPSSLVTVVNWL